MLVLGRYRFLKSVSVFGIFFGFFKSRFGFRFRFFQNIAISVRFFGFIYLFANLGTYMSAHSWYDTAPQRRHVHTYDTSSFSRRINSRSFKFLPETMSPVTSFRPLVHTKERHADQKSLLFSSAIQSIPDAPLSEKMMIVLTITTNY